jgi:plasmid stabilization system protein ParE
MIRFTVTWWPDTQSELLRLWLASAHRRRISEAADAIDRELAAHPFLGSDDLGEGMRRLVEEPLAVYFTVNEGDCTVTVWIVESTD